MKPDIAKITRTVREVAGIEICYGCLFYTCCTKICNKIREEHVLGKEINLEESAHIYGNNTITEFKIVNGNIKLKLYRGEGQRVSGTISLTQGKGE